MEQNELSSSINQHFSMLREIEFRKMIDFAKDNECLGEEICQNQLRALWTTYCLHHDIDVDTCDYDNALLSLWDKIRSASIKASIWNDYGVFDNFMCTWLC